MKTTKVFCLRHKKTKDLIGITTHSNVGQDFCGEESVYFDPSAENTWEAASISQAMIALIENPGWYNSSRDCPYWTGASKPDEYEIVEVTKTISEKPVKVNMPLKLPSGGIHVDIRKHGVSKREIGNVWYDVYRQAYELGASRGIIVTDIKFDPHQFVGKQIYLDNGDVVTVLGYSKVIDWHKDKCRMIYTTARKQMLED